MKKKNIGLLLLVLMLLAMMLCMTACSNNATIDPQEYKLENQGCSVTENGQAVDIDLYLCLNDSFKAEKDDEYAVFYSFGDAYQQFASYSINQLKKGLHLHLNYFPGQFEDVDVSAVVTKEDIASIQKIEDFTTTIHLDTLIPYCSRPIELEKEIEAKVSNYEDFLRTYDLCWHEYPMTNEDHIDNICYCLATGNFEWSNIGSGKLDLPEISTIKVEIAGHMLNQQHKFCFIDGHYYIALLPGVKSPLSPQDISNQIVEAYNAAKKIHDDLHSSGKITATMSQKQIGKIYSDFMQQYGTKVPEYFMGDNFPENYGDPCVRIKYMLEDTAYGCLVKKSGCCGSRAAAYNLLMNMEGIYTVGIHTKGHIVSYLFLDGNEYMCDWGNRIGLFTAEEVNSGRAGNIEFEGNWLENVRQFYHDSLSL